MPNPLDDNMKNELYTQIRHRLGAPIRKIELDFILLKRMVKKNPVEFFKVSAGEKTIRKALDRANRFCFALESGRFPKNKLGCHYCLAKRTPLCK